MLQTVLRLRGVEALTLGGNDSPYKRQQRVQRFREDVSSRVLIFSKVGNSGLNLACADTVIFAVSQYTFVRINSLTDTLGSALECPRRAADHWKSLAVPPTGNSQSVLPSGERHH